MVAVFKGRDMPPSQTLAECGLGATAEVVVVRRVLVPESAPLRRKCNFQSSRLIQPTFSGHKVIRASTSRPDFLCL